MREVFDFLVIGSGIAGVTFARKVAAYGTVAIVTKQGPLDANTTYAQGGVAAVMDEEHDTPEAHIRDTLIAGAGLCDPDVVALVVQEGPARIRELQEWGVRFTQERGRLHLAREGGHSRHRIVHAADATGREIARALLEQVRSHPNIALFDHHFALELIRVPEEGGPCAGAYVLDQDTGHIVPFVARATLLATGGAGRVYMHTTNPPVATGDGVAMAYRAGASVANMEFYQFHPTTLYHPEANAFLISEAVRGAGAVLLNRAGERFMPAYDPRAELAPRDIVAWAIDDQMKRRGDDFVLLDISHRPAEEVLRHFPTIAATCRRLGIDITREPIPVVPAVHYMCGGVVTDIWGATTIPGLFASGEVACTGLHGANRLASNSLLEGLVFSHRAAEAAVRYLAEAPVYGHLPKVSLYTCSLREEERACMVQHLRRTMWENVGIVRSNRQLEEASRILDALYEQVASGEGEVSSSAYELWNMLTVARLIVHSARRRRESRGVHFNVDYPAPREEAVPLTVI